MHSFVHFCVSSSVVGPSIRRHQCPHKVTGVHRHCRSKHLQGRPPCPPPEQAALWDTTMDGACWASAALRQSKVSKLHASLLGWRLNVFLAASFDPPKQAAFSQRAMANNLFWAFPFCMFQNYQPPCLQVTLRGKFFSLPCARHWHHMHLRTMHHPQHIDFFNWWCDAYFQIKRGYWATEERKMVSQIDAWPGLTQLATALMCNCI